MDTPGSYDPDHERRRFARVSNQFFVRVTKMGNFEHEDGEKIAAIVHDITVDGVAFLTNQDYQENDVLELEIEFMGIKHPQNEGHGLLNSATVVTRASVVRSQLVELGLNLIAVSFQNLDKSDRELIRQAITYQQ